MANQLYVIVLKRPPASDKYLVCGSRYGMKFTDYPEYAAHYMDEETATKAMEMSGQVEHAHLFSVEPHNFWRET